MLLINNTNTNAYFNLAMEEYFLKNTNEDIFLLWQNENSIIVGKNQNTLSEINYDYVKENNIKVVRRLSGGGAVFHDLGNINFTFISCNDNSFSDFKKFTMPIVEALKELNVHAEFSGRNDLLIDGQKFSGNAQYNYKNKVMHHGTLLFSSEINDLSNALKVKPSKFQGKSVKSVKSRVTNISSHLDKKMTVLEFKDYLMDFINKRDENSHFYELNDKDVESINKLVEEKYSTWEWNFGYSPKYSLYNELKYPGGNVEFSLDVHDGLIKDIKFFGDFFGKEDISFIENKLRNVKHNEYSIKSALEDVDINNYFLNCNIDILVSGIMGAK
ncbi:lipoate--protein ligase [Terrisporobacter sp.]|uniref:lipoate--protein ligase n=1 Tax=Terrisporobacter sp. TaxID=1965305 RepID=UPI002A804C88|nr:lipoate--protein ligase [Terrisporobacter sp.]MCI6459173.1 lipoate--protein ligase [Clostridium sp.]MCI7207312.1 lipoate--protein ligase [Clostridium sp.]MDY4736212.1 lipoate--protein ligase [Terrisporobacter sp.]